MMVIVKIKKTLNKIKGIVAWTSDEANISEKNVGAALCTNYVSY